MNIGTNNFFARLTRKYYFWIGLAIIISILLDLDLVPSLHFKPITRAEWFFLDSRIIAETYARGMPLDPKIIVAGIDEKAISGNPGTQIKETGGWPWPYERWALFLQDARKYGVRLVVIDILFLDEKPGHREMAMEMAKGPPVVLAVKGQEVAPGFPDKIFYPIPSLKERAAGLGFINVNLTEPVHWLPLVYKPDPRGRFFSSLDLETVRLLLKIPEMKVEPYRIILGSHIWPTTAKLHRFVLRWMDPSATSPDTGKGIGEDNYISASEMFTSWHSARWLKRIRGSVLIVGAASPELQDYAKTPLGNLYGVIVHANAINALLHDRYYLDAGKFLNFIFIALPALLLSMFAKKTSAPRGALITGFFIGVYLVVNFILFWAGYWVHLAGPSLAMILVYIGATTHHRLEAERKKSEITQIYGRYLAPQVKKELMEGYEAQKAELHGALREVTVLESDIRGFTTLSENLPAEEVVRFLNTYFTAMIPILFRHGGTWDKFIGDALLAYFGAPGHQPDHAIRAVECAVEMLEVIETMRNMGDIPFHVGIGVNTGIVKVGHIGADATETSEEQKQFTIIGDTVNLAARLCGHAEGGSLILSESTFQELKGKFFVEPLGPIAVKGKSQEVNAYRIRPETARDVKSAEEGKENLQHGPTAR